MTQTPEQTQFIEDWNTMVVNVAAFCEKYNQPKPDLIFHPQWRDVIDAAVGEPILDVLIFEGVRVRFARWEQRLTLVS